MFDLRAKLQKTRESFFSPLKKVFQREQSLSAIDEERVEELLLGSDMGVEACERFMEELRARREGEDFRTFLRREFLDLLADDPAATASGAGAPRAILVVGVNGVGKTTSIAKLAAHYRRQGKSVLLAAADTFRAAAREQLGLWAERLDLDLIAHRPGADPGAVAFDACTAAQARGVDYVVIDTAGRLHTRTNLMEELRKIKRVCEKVMGPGSVETLLALDATLGQNSLRQAMEFTKNLDIQGIILTKLDSTSKGGIVVAIKRELGVPVRFIGVGEAVEDLAPFSAVEFVDALLSD